MASLMDVIFMFMVLDCVGSASKSECDICWISFAHTENGNFGKRWSASGTERSFNPEPNLSNPRPYSYSTSRNQSMSDSMAGNKTQSFSRSRA